MLHTTCVHIFRCTAAVTTMLIVVATGTADTGELFPELTPNSELTASDVVRIQLVALSSNDTPHPDAGIEITFRFASPGNKQVTGPLPRFTELVKNPVYLPMINHTKAEYGQPKFKDGREMIPVLLTARDGKKTAFVFIVGQQEVGECAGCWMTEGVYRIQINVPTPGSDKAAGFGV